ncbi:MAG TPA: response regulator transcription factor [Terriglobia bacterium]|nr:response regulator transcription factor [Terriglobia bacterium]
MNPRRKIRLLIADQEGVFRLGLKKLFGVEDDLRVVAQAGTAEEALAMAREFKPDVVFLQAEIAKPDRAGLFADLRQASPEVKIVITASALGEEEPVRYVQGGAAGVILRSVDPPFFVKCARKVSENEVWLPKKQVAQMAKLLEGSEPIRPRDTLTQREKTIISYLMQGWRNREIARHLGITEQTVKNHLRTIYDKVGVSDRLELVLYAIHQRLELPPTGPAEIPPAKPVKAQEASHDAA